MKKFIIPGAIILVLAIAGAVFLITKTAPLASLTSAAKSSQHEAPAVNAAETIPSRAPGKIPAAPRTSSQDTAIKEIRHELQVVMDLNQKINKTQQSKSAQLLRIQEQAQIHQRILAKIQKASGDQPSKIPSRETLLAQEKLRIIREETLRNKKLLDETSRKPAA